LENGIGNSNYEFYVSNVHTSPNNATTEILVIFYLITLIRKALSHVVDFIRARSILSNPNIILLGDFNSDGSYFNEVNGWRQFFNKSSLSNFTNLITDNVDTTVSTGNGYTYDRMVVSRGAFPYFLNGSAKPFYFDNEGLWTCGHI
jgi:hypothetical protein